MPATDLSSHGAFARLARAFVEIGAAEHLPVLPKVGASDLDSAVALASAAVAEGVPPEVFEKLLAWRADQDCGPPTVRPQARAHWYRRGARQAPRRRL